MGQITAPIATYNLGGRVRAGLFIGNRLYLGGHSCLHVFEVTQSLFEPLIALEPPIPNLIRTRKILRLNSHLMLLVGDGGYLQLFDVDSSTVTHTHYFVETGGGTIRDALAIDEEHFLLAALNGIIKTTKDQLLTHYY
jgi:hypothetical protein